MINLAFIGVLGLLVFLMPHLGFPYAWKTNMYTVLGLLIIALAYRESRESTTDENDSEKAYVDSEPHAERIPPRLNGAGENAEGF